MSDGLKDWAEFIQLNPLVRQLIGKKLPQKDCQTCMTLVDQTVRNSSEKRMIFYICMELLQNISHHAIRLANQAIIGEFVFHQDETNWYILTKNTMRKADVRKLKEQLDQVNELHGDQLALKKRYREIIKSDTPIGKHAGLGLLDIVRKSKNALCYKFEGSGNANQTFTVMATIKKK